jgi:phosphatidylglycerol---prolipoprotein diacylglyceryl transferase
MSFPVYLKVGSVRLHPHLVFETLAYLVGYRVFVALRRRFGDPVSQPARWWVIAAAAAGAAVGSKLIYWFEDPAKTLQQWHNLAYLMGGKTIVGGLAGGLIAVEWIKRRSGITESTGDLFAIPLAVGVAIGRIGCFLTGLADDTYGNPTGLPWGVDFGDGIRRHPTQVYEIAFLLLLTLALWRLMHRPHLNGDVFKAFMVCYAAWRILVDFLKPGVTVLRLSPIQWLCVAVLVYYAIDFRRRHRRQETPGPGWGTGGQAGTRGAISQP